MHEFTRSDQVILKRIRKKSYRKNLFDITKRICASKRKHNLDNCFFIYFYNFCTFKVCTFNVCTFNVCTFNVCTFKRKTLTLFFINNISVSFLYITYSCYLFQIEIKNACDRIKTQDKIKILSYNARLRVAMQLLGKVKCVTKDPGRTHLVNPE